MKLAWKWIVLWSLWAARMVRQPTVTLRISNGLLRGSVAPDGSHKEYLALPYASLPHRFQAPGPEPTWDGVFEAINENILCSQKIGHIVIGREDCLVLNVYTPMDAMSGDLLPVMVFIHGGGFFFGSASKILYGPEYLVRKGVILVSINYRLNVQGFLCLGIKEAPGNGGMKDQVAAFKWVKKNIELFGGDPENVTIFGESAGGTSVAYHILSPMSKGLFHKAILQSGTAITSFGHQFRPIYKASLLAKTMGFDTDDPNEIYDIFRNKTDSELLTISVPREDGNLWISKILYVPCAEQHIDGVEPFINDVPYNILLKGDYNKVPMIIGTNIEEGMRFIAGDNDNMLSQITIDKSIPKDLLLPEEKRKEAVDTLERVYMDDDHFSKDRLLKLSRFYGDCYFHYPAVKETELLLKTNNKPIYNYLFRYYGWRNFAKIFTATSFIFTPGATHADELFYIFKPSAAPLIFENKMIDTMTTLWTNFAKHGDPTPASMPKLFQWSPTDVEAPRALVIDSHISTTPLWHSDRLVYWRQLYAKYRRTSN